MPTELPILSLPAPSEDGDLEPVSVAQSPSDDRRNERGGGERARKLNSVPTHTRRIGVMHPPPDIRKYIDKTAQFVAKEGLEFEGKIIANNLGNVKFGFLKASDPYHAFYQHRLMEAQQPRAQPTGSGTPHSAPADGVSSAYTGMPAPAAQFRPVEKVLDPPESELVPGDQFLYQHPGPVRIKVCVVNVDEGDLKGKTLDITMQSLSETVGSLKEKVSGEIQIPPNKQKLSGKTGFLKEHL